MAPKLSLYASLLGSEAQLEEQASNKDDNSSKKQSLNAAALRFQPTKRPQLNIQKPKPKIPKVSAPIPGISENGKPANSSTTQPVVKSSIADWTGGDDGMYFETTRKRGGRKKRKKNKDEPIAQDWDDLYDPTRPNNYEEYMQSDERIREIREWKERLYAHRIARSRSSDLSSDDDRPSRPANVQFAPPSSYNFAPPPPPPPPHPPPATTSISSGAVNNPPAHVDLGESADEVLARRMRMSQPQNVQSPIEPVSEVPPPPLPPPPPSSPPPPPPPSAVIPVSAIISRAPVRYSLPEAPSEIPSTEEELEEALNEAEDTPEAMDTDEPIPRSTRPGQKGFAERLMAKYGWTKGSGLGASGSGITTALKVKVDKKKKDGAAGRGTIVGGKRKGGAEEGKFGAMSEVVILKGMVDNIDLDIEMGPDGTLVQEIGEECGDKYGRVERVFIDKHSTAEIVPVFIHFTSQLSALRAVNALEGRVFNGNNITARFYDRSKFLQDNYDG